MPHQGQGLKEITTLETEVGRLRNDVLVRHHDDGFYDLIPPGRMTTTVTVTKITPGNLTVTYRQGHRHPRRRLMYPSRRPRKSRSGGSTAPYGKDTREGGRDPSHTSHTARFQGCRREGKGIFAIGPTMLAQSLPPCMLSLPRSCPEIYLHLESLFDYSKPKGLFFLFLLLVFRLVSLLQP
jgi:hypothetical protein